MKLYEVAILGGGWAGLLGARELSRILPSNSIAVLEATNHENAGGLLRSESIDGFTFDIGGPHILFSRDAELLADITGLLGDNVAKYPRRNFVFFRDQYIPYPFENGMYQLEPELRARLGGGLIAAIVERARNPSWRPATFKEWVYGVFGEEIGSEYLEPYNRKIWKRPLERMSADWTYTPGRTPLPDNSEISRAIAGVESIGYKEQSLFYYPKTGGIQSLYNALLGLIGRSEVDVFFGASVKSIRRIGGLWDLNGQIRCKSILSTIPLPSLLRALPQRFDANRRSAGFDYNQVLVVGVAIEALGPDHTAIFVPQKNVPFHRYTWMSYMNKTPKGCSNLIAEVTIPRNSSINVKGLVQRVREGLVRIGAVQTASKVIFTRSWLNMYGYPIYSLNHKVLRAEVLDSLQEVGIFSVGRWGSWEYWNTDMVLRAVKETVSTMQSKVIANR